MEFDNQDIVIASEDDLIVLVEQINEKIRNSQDVDDMEEIIDLKKILRLYRRMKCKEARDEFRILHDCKTCYYFQEWKCHGENRCLLEETGKRKDTDNEKGQEEKKDGKRRSNCS